MIGAILFRYNGLVVGIEAGAGEGGAGREVNTDGVDGDEEAGRDVNTDGAEGDRGVGREVGTHGDVSAISSTSDIVSKMKYQSNIILSHM